MMRQIKELLKKIPGLRPLVLFLRRKFLRDRRYERWIRSIEFVPPRDYYEDSFKDTLSLPLISVLVPVYNVKLKYLQDCVQSVLDQFYPSWQLCLCDDASTDKRIRPELERLAQLDRRIKVVFREKNGHISAATNSALSVADGEFVAFLDNDDILAPHALAEMALKIREHPDVDVLYSDVDNISSTGRRRLNPHFKPDWSPDTLMSCMYLIHLLVVRKRLVDKVGGLRDGFSGSQDYDLALRITEQTDRIEHIPQVLYHWRIIRSSTTSRGMKAKPYAIEAMIRAKGEALERRGIVGKLEYDPVIQQVRVKYEVSGKPLVSIIIPTRNHLADIKRCVLSLIEKTRYKNYEIIIVDNGSDSTTDIDGLHELASKCDARVIRDDRPFNFSAINNSAAATSNGDYLLFLNNDTEVINPEWLELMLGIAQQCHVGAVGARLLYPDGMIQHVGIVNYEVGPGHPYSGFDPLVLRSYRPSMDANWIAVTGACLLVAKIKFLEAGRFDEELAVAYNDVALCFSLLEKGYNNVVAQKALLKHYESKSRGSDEVCEDKRRRQYEEMDLLYKKFPKYKAYDPFYNINLIGNHGDFSVRNDQVKI